MVAPRTIAEIDESLTRVEAKQAEIVQVVNALNEHLAEVCAFLERERKRVWQGRMLHPRPDADTIPHAHPKVL